MKKAFLIMLCGLMSAMAFATPAPVVEGVDYTLVPAAIATVDNTNANKVTVKEFFSFTCIHCKDAEPLIEKTIMRDRRVNLERIQVPWDATTTGLAKLNATLQLQNLGRLYTPAFNAIFAHQDLNNQDVLRQFLGANKVTPASIVEFMNVYNSFTVSAKVAEYKRLMQQYNVSGTPTFIVANKYVVKPALPPRLVEVVEYLVNKSK